MWKIKRGLYLGDHLDAADQYLLSGMGITHVLNCAYEVPCYFQSSFEYLHLELNDPDPGFAECIEDLCVFIDAGRSAGGVLVHCRAGLSRSPSAIIAWLCHHGRTVEQSLAILQRGVDESDDTFFQPDELFLEQIRDHFGEEE